MATRKYEQRLRAESAEETRHRILDAVCQRLRAAPAEPVSIDQVARMARVSRSTVYQVFGSRAGLFGALGADLLDRGGFGSMLQAASHPDAREALRALATLPERQRTDLALKAAGYSYEEIRLLTPGRTFTNVNESLVKARARVPASRLPER